MESHLVLLDNPVWNALTTRQAHFAVGAGSARRFPPDMGPFIAIERTCPAAVAELGRLATPGEVLNLIGVVPNAPPGWAVETASVLSQMVYEGPTERREGADEDPSLLTADDVPAMLGLTAMVYPGYFRDRTIAMGTYLGVRREGQLVAMAGQRFCLDGHREISGICTHPAHRGRGHAGKLIARLVAEICGEGLIPFLHVDATNSSARVAYEKAGFARRRDLNLLRLRRVAEAEGLSQRGRGS